VIQQASPAAVGTVARGPDWPLAVLQRGQHICRLGRSVHAIALHPLCVDTDADRDIGSCQCGIVREEARPPQHCSWTGSEACNRFSKGARRWPGNRSAPAPGGEYPGDDARARAMVIPSAAPAPVRQQPAGHRRSRALVLSDRTRSLYHPPALGHRRFRFPEHCLPASRLHPRCHHRRPALRGDRRGPRRSSTRCGLGNWGRGAPH
jgi:hypothetical protein